MHSIPFINHVHGSPYDFHRLTYYGWFAKFKKINFNEIEISKSDNRYCCIINMLTSQINAALIATIKAIFCKKTCETKNIYGGDASPENKNSKKLKVMYFILNLNPVNFLLGLSCWLSNYFPSINDREMEITSAYIIKAYK